MLKRISFSTIQRFNYSTRKNAFTLAEVLITLTIIGVVAALTIPSIISKNQEKQTVVKLKKFYSVMSQAYISAQAFNGTIDNWDLNYETNGTEALYKKISPFLKINKDCGSENGCMPDTGYTRFIDDGWSLNFNGKEDRYNFILSDGSAVSLMININGDNPFSYGVVYIDTNGNKGPNKWGYDLFQFDFYKNKLIPSVGFQKEELDETGNLNDCLSFGYACSRWIVTYGNMDYLHCPDKLLTGAKSCK